MSPLKVCESQAGRTYHDSLKSWLRYTVPKAEEFGFTFAHSAFHYDWGAFKSAPEKVDDFAGLGLTCLLSYEA